MKFKRGQAWGFDLVVGLVIFLAGVLLFYFSSINSYDETKDIINTLSYEGTIVSDSILSEGYPINWSANNVQKIGILTNNKINQTKLEQFYYLSQSNYQITKNLLNTNNNYYFFLSQPLLINGTQVDGIGLKNNSYNNLIKINRYTIYNNKPTTINLYIWN